MRFRWHFFSRRRPAPEAVEYGRCHHCEAHLHVCERCEGRYLDGPCLDLDCALGLGCPRHGARWF